MSPNTKVKKRGFAALGQGTIEYALMLIFTGVGLVLVTGAVYTGLGQRAETVLCNVGNEGREEQVCEPVAQGDPDPDNPDTPDGDENGLPPIANLICVCDGLDCFVDAQNSTDQDQGGQSIVNYSFDFGTGFGPLSNSASTDFTFAQDGVYPVSVVVTDNEGDTDMATNACIVNTQPEPPAECPPFPDFDAYPPGTNMANIDFPGITIYSLHKNNDNDANFQTDHPVWTYDSTVNGEDSDLGTPNRAFVWTNGQGNEVYGVGDANHGRQNDGQFNNNWAATVVGGPYVNDAPLGNLLVIQEDTNGAPDDNSRGGRIVFEFDHPAYVDTLRFVDVDEGRAATVRMFDADGNSIGGAESPVDAGENTVVPLLLDQSGVSRLEVRFDGSGGLDSIFFCDQYVEEEQVLQPPVCEGAYPSDDLWPPNHRMVPINILGVTDPDGGEVTTIITSVFQDEGVDELGDGSHTPDATGVGTPNVEIRAERAGHRGGNNPTDGNGRVYHIDFLATDAAGQTCTGTVNIGVPHDQGGRDVPIDDGRLFDSTTVE